jgi:VCBS repeat protein
MTRVLGRLLCLFPLILLNGCAAGIAGVIMALASSGGGAGSASLPPVVTGVNVSPVESPEEIQVDFRISGENGGRLGALIEVQKLRQDASGLEPDGQPVAATPLPGSGVPEGVVSDQSVRFLWDARQDLNGKSGQVQLVVTPTENGKKGKAFLTDVFRAGNTLPSIENVRLFAQGTQVAVSFRTVDLESDPVTIESVEIAVEDGSYAPVPPAALGDLLERFPSSPSGAAGLFVFDIKDLGPPVSEPGFRGKISVRLQARDFPSQELVSGIGSFLYDNNEPPIIEMLPILDGDLGDGIVTIRYRIFDRDLNPARIEVVVDLNDGQGLVTANELPAALSEGRTDLSTLDPARFGDPENPYHIFLWDAGSQLGPAGGAEGVLVAIRGLDREEGPRSFQDSGRPSALNLLSEGEIKVGARPSAAASGDFNGDRFADLIVANQTSGTITQIQGSSSGLAKSTSREVQVGGGPIAIAIGDFNKDTFLDAVTANSISNDLTYLQGNSSGLSPLKNIQVGKNPVALASGDFDGDGILDVVVANKGSDSVSLLHGGSGGLSAAIDLAVGKSPQSLALGDFDGDGFLDVAVGNVGSRTITLLRGDRTGLIGIGETQKGEAPYALASGDFDGDGKPDLVSANFLSPSVTYYPGGPSGQGEKIGTGTGPLAMAVGDFDGDGFMDVVTANRSSNDVTFLRGGAGGLIRVGEIPAGSGPTALTGGDLDGDGFLDVVAANQFSDNVTYIRGGISGLASEGEIAAGNGPVAAITGDFGGGGFLSALVANQLSNSVISLRTASATLENGLEFAVKAAPEVMISGDFDGDGYGDVVAANPDLDNVTYLRGGVEGLKMVGEIATGDEPILLASGDIDGDGFLDAVTANLNTRNVTWLRGSPSGLIRGAEFDISQGLLPAPSSLAIGDFNDDGFLDVVVGGEPQTLQPTSVAWLPGSEMGLKSAEDIPVSGISNDLIAGDFDEDGFPDAVSANSGNTVTYLRGGPGGLSNANEITVGGDPVALTIGDFNGDGFPDIAVANYFSDNITFIRGSSSGLIHGGELVAGSIPVVLTHGDFNADGFQDVLVVDAGSNVVTYFQGRPEGLIRIKEMVAGEGPESVISGDFDGDSFPDVLVANYRSDDLTYFRGGPTGLERVRQVPSGDGPQALTSGDYDGDGFPDVVVGNGGPSTFTPSLLYFRQGFTHHLNSLLDPSVAAQFPASLTDPRNPPRFKLEIPQDALDGPTQVCLVPGPVFELPQGEAFGRKKYLLAVTDPMSIYRETTELAAPARLTLRLRDQDPELLAEALAHRGNLRVIRKDPATGKGADSGIAPSQIEIVDFARGQGAAFPVTRFGGYVLALEKDRQN